MAATDAYFNAMCQISRALGTTLSKDELLDMIVSSAIETMGAKAACLFLAHAQKDIFVPVAQQGLSERYLHAKPLTAQKLVGAIMDGGHLYFRDAPRDPRLEHHDLKKAEGIASILSVPVRVKDKTIGVLSLYTAQTREFATDEIEFLSALAEQGGMAVERARLFERINRNATIYLNLASRINAGLDIQKIMRTLTEETCTAFGMKGATIRLLNDQTGQLDLVSSCGLSREFLDKGPVSAEKSIADALKGKTVVIEDVASDKRIQYHEAFVKEGIVSMVCVPIQSREAVIGVMRLYSQTARGYPADLIKTLEALAHTGALAIQNVSMYLRLEQDKICLEQDFWVHRSYF
jgi:GAF domain-containing protein